ncbi:DUF3021 family protein [Secundilactobacillus kimchicus]|uniref:DUF3021 domain-containing protein n=1 Tax=Secundilactobacillus kimchicus TaxID=528209 RepID=UPI001C026F23|nr:DUF3021 domain-containing protein [Secundilactobacillus kimchicus]MBT9672084.1 DUF3021 family protein [Secundilactobacillus kimchicus]
MKNFKRRLLQLTFGAFSGIGIGFLTALTFSTVFKAANFLPSAPQFVSHFATHLQAIWASTFIWATIGLLFSGTALIFEIESWSSLKQTIVHFLISYLLFTPLAIWAGWFPVNSLWLLLYTLIFVLIYVFFWIIFSQSIKAQVQQINQLISKRSRNC